MTRPFFVTGDSAVFSLLVTRSFFSLLATRSAVFFVTGDSAVFCDWWLVCLDTVTLHKVSTRSVSNHVRALCIDTCCYYSVEQPSSKGISLKDLVIRHVLCSRPPRARINIDLYVYISVCV